MMSPATTDLFASNSQRAFLRRIADDDKFRAEVEADPRARLAELGLQIDLGDLPAQVTLPSKQALKSNSALAESFWPWSQRWYGFLG